MGKLEEHKSRGRNLIGNLTSPPPCILHRDENQWHPITERRANDINLAIIKVSQGTTAILWGYSQREHDLIDKLFEHSDPTNLAKSTK